MAVRQSDLGGGSRPTRSSPRSQGPSPRNNAGQPIGGGGGGVTGYLNQIRSQQMMGPQPGDVPMVYLGTETVSAGSGAAFRDPAGFGAAGVVQTASLAELMGQFDNWSEKRKRKMAEKMAIAGLFSQSPYQDESLSEFVARMTLGDVQQAYGSLLQAASARFQAGQRITPEQLLQQHIDYNKSAANAAGVSIFGGGGAGSAGFTGTKTQTSKSVDIFSAQDARGLARATLRRELDRDPTEEEFEDFVAALQAKQRANPTRTTTTSTFEDGDLVDQSSVSRGGLGAAGIEEFATRQAESNPGWAEWQAAGVLFPSVLASLGAGVPGV